jgi:Transmembrane domain of unknown function (DUF3566)
VSEGNAEQPSAQHPSVETPKGSSSPNRVEMGPQARQGVQEHPPTRGPEDQSNGNGSEKRTGAENRADAPQQRKPQERKPQERTPAGEAGSGPTAKPPDDVQKNSNGQNKESREEQLAAARKGAGATAAQGAGGPKSAPPVQAKSAQAKSAQAKSAQPPSTQQRPQPPAVGGQPAAAPPQNQPPAAAPGTPSAPNAGPAENPASNAVPVWDPPPPPQPKQSLLARLGIAKKAAPPEDELAAPPVPQTPAATPPAAPPPPAAGAPATGVQAARAPAAGTTGAGGAPPQARTPAQPKPVAQPRPPAGQPSVPQPQGRMGEATGRTPTVQGGARPGAVAPTTGSQATGPQATGPQARMPGPPTHPGAPGPFPVPAPVQALKDAATQTNPAIVAVPPDAETPELHHPAKPKVGVARRTRKARLRLSRLDPWSVMKTSFLFSIAAGIMLVVAVYSIWAVLSTSHLFDSINEIVRSVVSTPGDTTPFRIQEYINTQKVMGVTALIACVDVVIFTALATLGSFLYNLAATMLGGLEITLAED